MTTADDPKPAERRQRTTFVHRREVGKNWFTYDLEHDVEVVRASEYDALRERVSGMAVLLERLYDAFLTPPRPRQLAIDADYWRKEIRRELSTAVDNHVAVDQKKCE